ncbi:MAG: hypothetical protein NVS4B6_17190 [Mycobacterium sp.]
MLRGGPRIGLRRLLGSRPGIVAMVIVGTLVGVAATAIGLIALGDTGGQHPTAAQPPQQSDRNGSGTAAKSNGDASARRAWARQHGQDRSAMPDLPPVDSATPQQQAASADLLTQTRSGTAAYSDTARAQAAGYDVQAALARAEQAAPRLAKRLARIDAGHPDATPPMLRVINNATTHDGKVLDPNAPEMLLYAYQGHNSWKLVGAGYLANESYPQPPPDPGGPITRWHYDDRRPAILTMDVFFTAGTDLAHAYAITPPKT